MSNLFRSNTPAPPPVMASAPMPDPNSAAVREAAKMSTAAALSRSGRSSTIMGKQGTGGGGGGGPVATAADTYSGGSLGSSRPQ